MQHITAEHVARCLIISGIAVLLVGFYPNPLPRIIEDLYANFGTELISIGVVVLIIDRIRERRANERERKMLISQMASQFNILACDAARIIRERGWHKELKGISLWRANLEEAELYEFVLVGVNLAYANLKKANLNAANLDGATLNEANLAGTLLHGTGLRNASIYVAEADKLIFKDAKFFETDLTGAEFSEIFAGIKTESPHPHLRVAYSLCGSIMPDGKRYDGRYNLQGDLKQAASDRDGKDLSTMADFYGVSIKEYEQGQTWRIEYAKYMKTREKKARALCAKKGWDWDKMSSTFRGRLVDTFLQEP
ncbi:MAG: pentapeptide repeat-containing protein [Chloroflexota bacterium]